MNMRALYYIGTKKSELREVDAPSPKEGEVLIEVSHCGICGSDMHAWHGLDERRMPPIILGHEAVGIAQSGKYKGKRVAVNPLHTCGECKHCIAGDAHLCVSRRMISMQLPGAIAEQCIADEANLYPIDDALADEDAALCEPLAVCVHAIRVAKRTMRDSMTKSRIVVLGGGAIGVLCAILADYEIASDGKAGEMWIAEANEARRELLGSVVPNARAYNPMTDGAPEHKSADLVLDCVGSVATRKAASELIAPGGTIVHVGLQENGDALDTRYFTLQEVTFAGTYCYTPEDFATALELLTKGIVRNKEWIDVRPLEQGAQSFQDIHNGTPFAKIILDMQN